VKNELIESHEETICYVSDFKFPRSRLSKDKPRTLGRGGTRIALHDISGKPNVNLKLERRKEREKQEIVYFIRV
jgi:hypothetical protein